MDLWLLRHAEAQERAASGRDEDRVLTPEGVRRAAAVAAGLAELKPGIEVILTSPYRRARQTALPAAKALGLQKRFHDSRALEPGHAPEEILEDLEAQEGWNSVLLVGHEPHLGDLLGRLVMGGKGVSIPLKKAAVARVEVERRWSGTLRALLPAKVLEELGRARPSPG